MLERILVAVDLKENNTFLMENAIALANTTGAQLKLLHVFSSEDDPALMPYTYPGLVGYPVLDEESVWQEYQERYQRSKDESLSKLRHLSDQSRKEGIQTEYVQEVGSPGRMICELATSWQASLVMVGSHGRRGLSELLLGSVSNYVMHHAPCSVMVVHPSKTAEVKDLELAA